MLYITLEALFYFHNFCMLYIYFEVLSLFLHVVGNTKLGVQDNSSLHTHLTKQVFVIKRKGREGCAFGHRNQVSNLFPFNTFFLEWQSLVFLQNTHFTTNSATYQGFIKMSYFMLLKKIRLQKTLTTNERRSRHIFGPRFWLKNEKLRLSIYNFIFLY